MLKKKILITGAAGFIGFHLIKRIHSNIEKHHTVGVDNLNNYYSKKLKLDRLKILKTNKNFLFKKVDVKNFNLLQNLFKKHKFDYVIHLAAQAGVRHSLKKPKDYVQNNLIAFFNLLECCRIFKIKHLIFASTSSVYGESKKIPFKENHSTDYPIQFYAATKKSNEVMAHSYSHIYNLPTTGLRFFTVYGPWGRPDMAYFKFTKNIIQGKQINVYGNGNMYRDFTYIDDAVTALTNLINIVPSKKNSNNLKRAPAEIYNIGNNKPESLENFIQIIESATNLKATKNYMPMQAGDIYKTSANINKIKSVIDFKVTTNINQGLPIFIDWYKNFYKNHN